MVFEYRFTKNQEEAEEAFSVSIQSFYPNEKLTSSFLKSMKLKWFSDPSYCPSMILVCISENKIVGGMRGISRLLRIGNSVINMLGLAEIFVLPSFNGLGITRGLTENFLRFGHDKDFDIITCVARKKIDGFYLKYGLFGFGSFPKLSFQKTNHKFLAKRSIKEKITFEKFKVSDVIKKAYEDSYINIFGAYVRDKNLWEFQLLKIHNSTNLNIKSIYINEKLAGYVVYSKGRVLELALLNGLSYQEVVSSMGEVASPDKDYSQVVFELPRTHGIFNENLKFDVKYQSRECYFGGHILKVLNIQKFVGIYNSTFLNHNRHSALLDNDFFKVIDKRLVFDGPPALSLSYEETIELVGIETIYSNNSVNQRTPWFVGAMEEF